MFSLYLSGWLKISNVRPHCAFRKDVFDLQIEIVVL